MMSNLTTAKSDALVRRSSNAACGHFTLLVRLDSTNAIDRLAGTLRLTRVSVKCCQYKNAGGDYCHLQHADTAAGRQLDHGPIALLLRSLASGGDAHSN
jgi:hypothetical protein